VIGNVKEIRENVNVTEIESNLPSPDLILSRTAIPHILIPILLPLLHIPIITHISILFSINTPLSTNTHTQTLININIINNLNNLIILISINMYITFMLLLLLQLYLLDKSQVRIQTRLMVRVKPLPSRDVHLTNHLQAVF
jgi:hypothetical protein